MNELSQFLLRLISLLPRPLKRVGMVLGDALLLMFAVWAAFALRLGQGFVPNGGQFLLMLAAPLLALPIFIRMGLYRSVIRYLGEQALWTVVQSVSLATLLWAALAFMTQMTGLEGVPRSVPLLYGLVGLVLVGGYRFVARALIWMPLRERFSGRQILIYGAGDAGWQLARALRQGRDYFPAGFLDDQKSLQGKDVGGLRVYAPDHLPVLMSRFDIHDVIVALPAISAQRRREVVGFLERFPIRVRVLPALADLANGTHLINQVREVDLGDLLGREPVAPDTALLRQCVTGKVVLVTGAGGSIGTEICYQVALLNPRRLVLVESSEPALYQIDRQLRKLTQTQVVPCLGSVENRPLLQQLFVAHGVETVYHAAAHKHVPLVEANVQEGVHNNVLGTLCLVQEARQARVETFVLISTDKAVRPTSVMGATKRWAELIVQTPLEVPGGVTTDGPRPAIQRSADDVSSSAIQRSAEASLEAPQRPMRFSAVRFGNVLGSSGSVIPLFREQIAQGGPVTVTHPQVTRYFMSIHEAVELVIQAGSMAHGGEIFLLDMGEPVCIADMARNLIHMAGYTVRGTGREPQTIEIVYTGLRPGEKLCEELLISAGDVLPTAHPKILSAQEPGLSSAQMAQALGQLTWALEQGDERLLREVLFQWAS